MNHVQRWLRRLGQALAVLRDPDAGLLLPLPPPLVDPRLGVEQLANQAREQGRIDGRLYLYDGWSFGRHDEPPGTVREPAYIEQLRGRCESAVQEHHDRQKLTEARMADLQLVARDAERDMRAARQRMALIAVRDQLRQDNSLHSYLRRHDVEAAALPPALDSKIWEGEAPPMRLIWRVPILLLLIAVVYVIEHYAAETYLPLGDLGQSTRLFLTAAIAGLTVIGPLVSGQLFRNRHATGYDGVLAAVTFALLLPSLAIILIFGLRAATLAGGTDGTLVTASRAGSLDVTPATLMVVFDVVLFLACAMAYVLGLAQRHPFQQAFVNNRQLRYRTVNLIQRMGTRINADYRASFEGLEGDGQESQQPASTNEREAAIRHAYRAAEDAYYQGLIEAVADPTFTEAIMRRRTQPSDAEHD